MSSLEATIAELRSQAELATSQAQFMEKVHTPLQEDSNFESEVHYSVEQGNRSSHSDP